MGQLFSTYHAMRLLFAWNDYDSSLYVTRPMVHRMAALDFWADWVLLAVLVLLVFHPNRIPPFYQSLWKLAFGIDPYFIQPPACFNLFALRVGQ